MTFRDRSDAGSRLALLLSHQTFENPVVLALPRGGVPVAVHVAAMLGAPLEVFVARKVGAPGQPEFGIGAIAEGSDEVVITDVGRQLGIAADRMRSLVNDERVELARRVNRYRGAAPLPELAARDVILVDDGLATGVTAEAALRSLRGYRPRRLVLAAPVCPPDTARRLLSIADDVVIVETPAGLGSIGAWYDDFTQTSDDEVADLLATARSHATRADTGTTGSGPGGRGDGGVAGPGPAALEVPGAGTVHGDLRDRKSVV